MWLEVELRRISDRSEIRNPMVYIRIGSVSGFLWTRNISDRIRLRILKFSKNSDQIGFLIIIFLFIFESGRISDWWTFKYFRIGSDFGNLTFQNLRIISGFGFFLFFENFGADQISDYQIIHIFEILLDHVPKSKITCWTKVIWLWSEFWIVGCYLRFITTCIKIVP